MTSILGLAGVAAALLGLGVGFWQWLRYREDTAAERALDRAAVKVIQAGQKRAQKVEAARKEGERRGADVRARTAAAAEAARIAAAQDRNDEALRRLREGLAELRRFEQALGSVRKKR